MKAAGCVIALSVLLVACGEERRDPLLPPDAQGSRAAAATGGGTTQPLVLPDGSAALTEPREADGADDVPHIYMALEQETGGPVSVVLAIDRSRDNTPADDPAIRITPADGQCNPQQLRAHPFPHERAHAPSYGPAQAASGVTARDLPDYMARTVASEIRASGLAIGSEGTEPQTICTRKLLQRMIIDRSAAG